MLKPHFQEKSASEQLLALQNIIQGEEENARVFLFRAFAARDKLLKAAEKDLTISMSKEFVQGLFLRAVETGMVDDKVLNCIRSDLQKLEVTDQELMKKVQYAMSSYAERDTKQKLPVPLSSKPTRRQTTVNNISSKPKEYEESLLKVVVEKMENMEKEFKGLKTQYDTDMKEMKQKCEQKGPQNNRKNVWFKKCEKCQTDGVQRCSHCFKCGSGDHKIADCQEGNGDRSQ